MDKIDAVLLDIDGVLYTGDNPVPGAAETVSFLYENEIPFRCLSNTTRKSRRTISERLKNYGLDIPENMIITPAAVVGSMLKEKDISRCFLLTYDDVKEDLVKDGIMDDDSGAEAVVVGDAGKYFDYSSMNRAFRILLDGSAFYALEKDRYWMDNDGLSLSAGPFVHGLEYASGRSASLVGKPSVAFFEKALESMGAAASGTVMVGDDINSDIGGSRNAGMRGILVRTGKFSEERLNESGIAPDMIIDSIRDLPGIIGGRN